VRDNHCDATWLSRTGCAPAASARTQKGRREAGFFVEFLVGETGFERATYTSRTKHRHRVMLPSSRGGFPCTA